MRRPNVPLETSTVARRRRIEAKTAAAPPRTAVPPTRPASSLVEYPTIASFANAVNDKLAAAGVQTHVDIEQKTDVDSRRAARETLQRRRRSARPPDFET